MKTNKFLRQHRLRLLMRLLRLTVALSLTINTAGNISVALRASTNVTQQPLEQGRSVAREIAEGEVHSYRMNVKTGEFIHVVVRKLGVNVRPHSSDLTASSCF